MIGVWWTTNGIGTFLIDWNFATGHLHGRREVFGVVTVTANAWHAVFHLVPGLLWIAVSNRSSSGTGMHAHCWSHLRRRRQLGAGGGENSLGVIAVDTPCDIVHSTEGLRVLRARLFDRRGPNGMASQPVRRPATRPRSGHAAWPVGAPSCLGGCDPRSGPRRGSREVIPSGCRCLVSGVVDSVVVVELALGPVRHQANDAEVQVAHDRAPPGSGTGSETTTASDSD